MNEQVVLANAQGLPCGTADKATVHTTDTPLHFAFSCYLLDHQGRVLITRRALGKKTWPGVWTNSFCGHPGVGEHPAQAVHRRGVQELGVPEGNLEKVEVILPDFAYTAVDSSGIMENEICPVYLARLAPGGKVQPAPAEVDSYHWLPPQQLMAAVDAAPAVFSPWMVQQLSHPDLREALTRASTAAS